MPRKIQKISILAILVFMMGCGAAHTVRTDYAPEPTDKAFEKMLTTVQQLGWTITSTDKESGVISAEKVERRQRKPEFQATIVITPRENGSDVQVSVTKAGRRARRKVKQEVDEILERFAAGR